MARGVIRGWWVVAGSLLACGLLPGFTAAAQPAPVADPGPQRFRDCPDCLEMVVVPAGHFLMGSTPDERIREGVPKAFADRETLRHPVTIARPFAMGRFEVTKKAYADFVADTHRPDPRGCGVFDAKTDSWPITAGYSWRKTGFNQTDDQPAACISWQDAHDYAAWLARKVGKPYRLASEAEWEYAARGGGGAARYWGDSPVDICERANIMTSGTFEALGSPKSWTDKPVCASGHAFTRPVGSYAPNPFGLYDMLGNVFEWVSDCYHPTFDGAPADGSSWETPDCALRMPKGGAFHSLPWLARPAFRGGPVPSDVNPVAAGIRVVRDLD